MRHALARAVSAIAELELTTSPVTWPTLLPGLYEATRSPERTHRETAVYVLFSLLDTVFDSLDAQHGPVFDILSTTLRDPESGEVRMTTLRGLAKVAEYISTDEKAKIKAFQELIVPMLQVTQQAITEEDDEGVKHAYDVFETLLILDTPLVAKHVTELTQFFLGVAANKEVDETMRCGALNVLAWIVRYKKSKVQALGLAKPIIEGLLPIGCEDDPEDVDEDSPSRVSRITMHSGCTDDSSPSDVSMRCLKLFPHNKSSPSSPLNFKSTCHQATLECESLLSWPLALWSKAAASTFDLTLTSSGLSSRTASKTQRSSSARPLVSLLAVSANGSQRSALLATKSLSPFSSTSLLMRRPNATPVLVSTLT